MRCLSLLAIISFLCYMNQPLMAAEDSGKAPKAPTDAGGSTGGSAVEEIRSGLKSDIRLIFFAGVGGGIIGLSTLSFVDKPSRELKRLSIGFAVGAIIASVVVLYKKTSSSMTGGGITNLGVVPSAVAPVPYQDPYYEGEEEEGEEEEFEEYDEDYFLNTGSPHYVKIVENIDSIDAYNAGKNIRWDNRFQPKGTNADFIMIKDDHLVVRTFERGVENLTLSCGTGVVASAIVAAERSAKIFVNYRIKTDGGDLKVKFKKKNKVYTDIWLEGPVVKVFDGVVEL